MPKFVCTECKKILIRSATEIRVGGRRSYCEQSGKTGFLTRLRIKHRPKRG